MLVSIRKGRHIEGKIHQRSELQQQSTLHSSATIKNLLTMVEEEYESGASQPKLKPKTVRSGSLVEKMRSCSNNKMVVGNDKR